MSSAAKVLAVARAEIGTCESPAGSNKVKYNTEYYGRAVSGGAYSWCAVFVWWVFKHAGCPELYFGGGKSAYCPTIADYYIARKQTVAKSAGQAGDIVLFDWEQNSSSDHIGIIESKNSDGSYTTIEGNTSTTNQGNGGCVMRRTRKQSQISWIVRPAYTEKTTVTAASSVGSISGKLSVDGSWGTSTTRLTQKVLGTTQDGIVSGQRKGCKKYLQAASTTSWQFSALGKGSQMIRALQKLVGSSADGVAGRNTVIMLQKFLKNKGYYTGAIDGYMGVQTVKGWQKYVNSKL